MNCPKKLRALFASLPLLVSLPIVAAALEGPNRTIRVQLLGAPDEDLRVTLSDLIRRAGFVAEEQRAGEPSAAPQRSPYATVVIDRAGGWTEVRVDTLTPPPFHVRRALSRRQSLQLEDEEIRLVVRSILRALIEAESETSGESQRAGGIRPVPDGGTTASAGNDAAADDAGSADRPAATDADADADEKDGAASNSATADGSTNDGASPPMQLLPPPPSPKEEARLSPRSSVKEQLHPPSSEFRLSPFVSVFSFANGHAPLPGAGAHLEWTYARSPVRPGLALSSQYQLPASADQLGVHLLTTSWPTRLYGSVEALRYGRFILRAGAGAGIEFVFGSARADGGTAVAHTPPVYAMASIGAALRLELIVIDGLTLFASGLGDALVNRPRFVVDGAASGTLIAPNELRAGGQLGVSIRLGPRGGS